MVRILQQPKSSPCESNIPECETLDRRRILDSSAPPPPASALSLSLCPRRQRPQQLAASMMLSSPLTMTLLAAASSSRGVLGKLTMTKVGNAYSLTNEVVFSRIAPI